VACLRAGVPHAWEPRRTRACPGCGREGKVQSGEVVGTRSAALYREGKALMARARRGAPDGLLNFVLLLSQKPLAL